jgi:serine/threonine-protein kinase
MRRIVEETIPPPTSVRRDYPPALELIVMRALEKSPADRYQSAEEMRNDLEEFLDESGFRTGPRRMAIYLKQLFAPDAPVTEEGVAQARQLAEADSEPKVIAADESEELNFDRRTSFTMRVEAAPAVPRPSPALPLAAAPVGLASLSPGPDGDADGEGAGLSPTSVGELPPGMLPPEPRSASSVDTLAPAGGFPIAAATGFNPKALSPKALLAMAGSGQRSGVSGWLILAVIVLILGVGAMVFVGLK